MLKDFLALGIGGKTMGRKLNIRPTSGVYSTYRRLSYQPWSAIAEFVDNSTQSFYDHRDKLFSEVKYYKGLKIEITYKEDAVDGDSLEIVDNAFGMEWDDFQRALILDRPPKNTNGRNEFGMGLKTAACWFGSFWTVESTMLGSTRKYRAEMDIDMLEKYKNEEIDVQEEFASAKANFTKITITRLNKKITGARTKSKIKELLSSMYRHDLRKGDIQIFWNGVPLEFKEVEPFVETQPSGEKKCWKKDVSFVIDHEGKELTVNGFVAIRIPASLQNAGFTLLRRGRVIVGGPDKNYRPREVFGESNDYEYQRLYGELHMDNWPVTQAKDDFDWHNSGLEEKFIDKLVELTKEYKNKAQTYRVREIVKSEKIATTLKNALDIPGVIDVTVQSVPQQIASTVPPIPKNTTTTDKPLNEVNTEGNDPSPDSGVAIDGSNNFVLNLTYKQSQYEFKMILDMNSPLSQWLIVCPLNDDETEFELTVNMKHPFFEPLIGNKDFIVFMMKFVAAFVLAEVESGKSKTDGMIESDDIRLKMNEFLETIANNGEVNNG